MMADTRDKYVCGVCYRGIARVSDENGVITGFIHPIPNEGDIDHETEPVLEADAGLFDEVCDFCNAPDVAWVEYAEPQDVMLAAGHMYRDDGEWAACDACHDLIVKEDRVELVARSIVRFQKVMGVPKSQVPELLRQFTTTHEMFWNKTLNKHASVVVRP